MYFNRIGTMLGSVLAMSLAAVPHTFPLLTSLGAERPHRSAGSVGKTYRYPGTDWSETRNGKREVARRLKQKRRAELKAQFYDLPDTEQKAFRDIYNPHGGIWGRKTLLAYIEVMGGL